MENTLGKKQLNVEYQPCVKDLPRSAELNQLIENWSGISFSERR